MNGTTVLERAVVALAKALAPLVAEELRRDGASAPEFYDQTTSPLGNRRHRTLCKQGRLPHRKLGRRYLVARTDMEKFLATLPTKVREETSGATALDLERVGARIFANAAGDRRGGRQAR